jgi:ferrochelatase
MSKPFDALLIVSFGGPECREDVIPFLENVTRGKNVPRERLLEVAEHYYHFGGASPINQQNRELMAALGAELAEHGPRLPIYWGNRNWHPMLPNAIRQMRDDGVQRALAFVTSAFSSYSGCRQYREDIEQARAEVGTAAPLVEKLRPFFNHPGFIEAVVGRVQEALANVSHHRRIQTQLVFTAHSIPVAMANGTRYVEQLHESCSLVADRVGGLVWALTYQSRSGPPSQPWLEPDIGDWLHEFAKRGERTHIILIPIGFISDHVEILFDLDYEARSIANAYGLQMVRAGTVGTHPRFVRMIRELISERTEGLPPKSLGVLGPNPDVCPEDCCLSGRPALPNVVT